MNKKILAAAVAAAVVGAPAAFAESTVYGKFHVSIDKNDIDNTKDNWEANSRASRLGFKGSEDLGGGLKAIYQLELSVDVTDGTGVTGTNRNTFLGLAGDWGTFLVGRHDTPAKVAFYAGGNDVLGDSILDLNPGGANPIGVFTERRASNAIAYVSPNFSGFTVAAAVIPGEQTGSTVANTTNSTIKTTGPGTIGIVTTLNAAGTCDGLADHYSLGLMYGGGGLKAGLGYEKIDSCSAARDDKMWQAGASYSFGAFQVGAQYEDRDKATADYKAWAIIGSASFGNNAVHLEYTDSENDPTGAGATTDTKGWGLGGEHNFSKRTKVYAAYATNEKDNGTTKDDDDRFSLGMIHSF